MNTNFVRINGMEVNVWPVVLACAAYAMAFYIIAMTMTSISLVA